MFQGGACVSEQIMNILQSHNKVKEGEEEEERKTCSFFLQVPAVTNPGVVGK